MPHQPLKPDLPARFHRYGKKRLYCILAAVFFVVGIFGNLAFGGFPMLYGCFGAGGYVPGGVGVSIEGTVSGNAGLPVGKIAAEECGLSVQAVLSGRKGVSNGFGAGGGNLPALLSGGMLGRFAAEKVLRGLDDFQIASDAGSGGQNAYRGVKLVTMLPFVEEDGEQFCPGQRRGRLWPGEKKIRLFYVVVFIHRTDGKKKSCFA